MVEINDTIAAKPRIAGKKGDARKLRAAGLVPAVAYGSGSAPQHLALEPKQFVAQRFAFGRSHIYDVAVDGGKGFKAFIKDIQQEPVTRQLLHVDLYQVDLTKPIRVEVPIEVVGKAAGIIEGGMLTQLLRKVAVQCLPGQIPAKLVADVTPLGLGETLHLRQLPLPEGVKLMAHGEDAVAAVVAPEAVVAAVPAPEAAAVPAAAAASKAPDKK